MRQPRRPRRARPRAAQRKSRNSWIEPLNLRLVGAVTLHEQASQQAHLFEEAAEEGQLVVRLHLLAILQVAPTPGVRLGRDAGSREDTPSSLPATSPTSATLGFDV